MNLKQTSFNEILSLKPHDFADWVSNNFLVVLPLQVETIEDMRNSGKLLLVLANHITYLNSLQ